MRILGFALMFVSFVIGIYIRVDNIDMSETRLFIEFLPMWFALMVWILVGCSLVSRSEK